MHPTTKSLLILFGLLAACSAPAPESSATLDAPAGNDARTTDPLPTKRVVKLAEHAGESFYDVLMQGGGIVDLMTEDQDAPFRVVSEDQVLASLNDQYTPKVISKVGSQAELAEVVTGLRVEEDLDGYSTNELKAMNVDRAFLEILGLASGAGVQVVIDQDNFFYNISYVHGERKPGRSYGVGPARKSDDTSYPDYFRRMDAYLDGADAAGAERLVHATMSILTASDASAVDGLDKYGENLVTDFFLIYVAEGYRKLTGGSGGAFHKDLLETTLVSVWSHATGKVPSKNGEAYAIVDGDLRDFINSSENGSGLGFNKNRHKLQREICEAVREMNPALIGDLEAITGTSTADCLTRVGAYLNDPAAQPALRAQAGALTEAVVRLVAYTRAHADEILARIQ